MLGLSLARALICVCKASGYQLQQLKDQLVSVLGVNSENVDHHFYANLKFLQDELRVSSVQEPEGQAYHHYISDLFLCEKGVGDAIQALLNGGFTHQDPRSAAMQIRINKWIEQYCEKTETALSEEQRSAVKMAASQIFGKKAEMSRI